MIKSSIVCVLRFLECLIANKYTYQIWDPNSHWKSDFLSRVFLQWRSAITETKNVRAKGEGLDRGRPGLPVTSSYPQKLKEKFFLVIFIVHDHHHWWNIAAICLIIPTEKRVIVYPVPFYKELKQRWRRRLRKRYLQSDLALLQTFLRLFHLAQFVKCWQIFLELKSKRLYENSGKGNIINLGQPNGSWNYV